MAKLDPNSEPRKSWRRRAQARPNEILDAALDVFIDRGFDAARIEDIAARAGLSKGAIYLYFESKEALLQALIEREIAPLVSRAFPQEPPRAGTAPEILQTALLEIAGRLKDPRLFAVPRLVISVAGRFPEIARHYRDKVVGQARARAEDVIRRGIEDGHLRAVDPSAAARALVGPILFEALWAHVLGGETDLKDHERFVRHQMDLWLNGVAAEQAQCG